MMYNPEKISILVFGASGFIGETVAAYLQNKGYTLRTPSSQECNLFDVKQVRQYLLSIDGPFRIVFCAAILPYRGNSSLEMLQNIQMVQSLVEVASGCSIRSIIYLSTADVYGFPSERITEKTKISPRGYYGLGKFAGEVIMNMVAVPVTILRLPGVYGPGDQQKSIVGLFLHQLANRQSLHVNGDGRALRDYVEVNDVCRLIEHFIGSPYRGTINVATGRSVPIKDIIGMIGKALGVSPTIHYKENKEAPSQDLVFDVAHLREIVPSFRLTDIAQGIDNYANCLTRQ